jgi:uncharacterized membrane protein YwzB
MSIWKILAAIIIASITAWLLKIIGDNEDNFKPDTVKTIQFAIILIAIIVGYNELKNVL